MPSRFDQVIDRLGTRSAKWSRYAPEVLPLWVADMDFAAPEPVLGALEAAANHGVFGYEWPTTRLLETVAARLERLYAWKVSPQMVVATPGIVAGFNAAARAVCGNEGGLLIQTPVYHPFFDVAANAGAFSQEAPLQRAPEPGTVRYEVEWDSFEHALNSSTRHTEMFLLCHPHNPTGQIYSRSDLERFSELCLKNNTVICSDEIHSELLLGGARHTPLASVNQGIGSRSITLISASKTFNVVGLLCGFAVIPDRELRARYKAVLDNSILHVNSLGLVAAEAALSGACDGWLAELKAYLTANRDYLFEFSQTHWPGLRMTRPDATYLAWLDFGTWLTGRGVTGDPQRFFLEKAHVALNRGADFGPGGESFVRLNFGCPRATLAEALERMRKATDDI